MRNVATITWLTFHEAWRRWVVIIALLLGVAFIALFALGVEFILNESRPRINIGAGGQLVLFAGSFLVLAGLYVVHFLTIMLSIMAAIDAISGEIQSHTIQTIVTKPIARAQVILGKWLGYAAMLIVYIGLLTGGVLGTVHLILGFDPPNAWAAFALFTLEALVLLSLSLLLGTRVSTLANGITLFMLYGLAFIGSWVEQIASLPGLNAQSAIRLGQLPSWIMPVETIWRRIAFLLEPAALRQFGGNSPFSAISVPDPSIVSYAAGYVVVLLALAMWSFSRRDL